MSRSNALWAMAVVVVVVLLLLSGTRAAHADASGTELSLPLSPYLDTTFADSDAALRVGLQYSRRFIVALTDITGPPIDPNLVKFNALALRLYVDVPRASDQTEAVQLDRFSTTWKLHLNVIFERRVFDTRGAVHRYRYYRFAIDGGWGIAGYTYHPGGGDVIKTDYDSSGAFSLDFMTHLIGSTVAAVTDWAPQIQIGYQRQFAASSPTLFVVPPQGAGPATVTSLVVTPAAAQPSLFVRASALFRTRHDVGFGPSLMASFAGGDNDAFTFGAAGRFNVEFWVYYMKSIEQGGKGVNVRLGAAPFVSVLTYGNDANDAVAYGGLVSLRVGGNSMHY